MTSYSIELYQAYRDGLVTEAWYQNRLAHNGNNYDEMIEIEIPVKGYGMDIIIAGQTVFKMLRSIGTGAMQTVAHTLNGKPTRITIITDNEDIEASIAESDSTYVYPTVEHDELYTILAEL